MEGRACLKISDMQWKQIGLKTEIFKEEQLNQLSCAYRR